LKADKIILMFKFKLSVFALAGLTAFAFVSAADDTKPQGNTTSATNTTNAAASSSGAPKKTTKQADVASTTAKFGTVAKTSEAYKSALDAHALTDAVKLVDTEGAFKGTVAKVFEPRGLAIVEFDENYKTALTAIVRSASFTNFPALTNLIGKNVLVTGKFIKYRESAEIVLEKPEQIKLAE
jgi:hypothetical protein